VKRTRIARISGSSNLGKAVTETTNDTREQGTRLRAKLALLDSRVPDSATATEVSITNLYP
jgi:hypothetical protein